MHVTDITDNIFLHSIHSTNSINQFNPNRKTIMTSIKIDNGVMRTKDWCATLDRSIIQSITRNPRFETIQQVLEGKLPMHTHQRDLVQLTTGIFSDPKSDPTLTHKVLYCSPTGSGKTSTVRLLIDGLARDYPDAEPLSLNYKPTDSGLNCRETLMPSRNSAASVLILTVPCCDLLRRMVSELAACRANAWCIRKMAHGYAGFRMAACKSGQVHSSLQRSGDEKSLYRKQNKQDKSTQDIRDGDINPSPDMLTELDRLAKVSRLNRDVTPGRCQVLLCDIETTRALVQAMHGPQTIETQTGSPSKHDGDFEPTAPRKKPSVIKFPDFLRPENCALFIDEPNFGMGMSGHPMSAFLQTRMSEILAQAPRITILASATLSTWTECDQWWRGNSSELDAYLHRITADPYGQPFTKLFVSTDSTIRLVDPVSVFTDSAATRAYIETGSEKDKGFLTRFFDSDKTARRDILVPDLAAMSHVTYTNDKVGSERKFTNMKDLCPKTGISLIYSNQPMHTARRVCGLLDDAKWQTAVLHMTRLKTKTAQQEKQRVKLEAKRKPSDSDDDGPDTVTCQIGGLSFTADEIEEISAESLTLIHFGVVINTADIEPEINRIFQEVILSRPDESAENGWHPITILVCDYNGLYGLDCPGVSNVVICDDLSDLPRDDLIQGIGRLRVPGQVIFESFRCIQRLFRQPETPVGELISLECTRILTTTTETSVSELSSLKRLVKRPFAGQVLSAASAVLELYLAMLSLPEYSGLFKRWRPVFDDYGAEYSEQEQAATIARLEGIQPCYAPSRDHVLKVLSVVFDFDDYGTGF